MKHSSFLLLAILALACGCNSRKDKGSTDDVTTPIVSASEISFSLVSQNVFSKSCTSCHGAQSQGGVNLETYANALPFAKQIKADVDSGHMPKSPGAPLTQRQKALIDLWVAQGAPDQAGGPAAPPPPPLTATFASIKESVFKPKCLTCHNPTGRAKGVKLDQPSDLLAGQNILVVPGKPEESPLVRVISPGARRPMPPPNKAPPLGADEVAQITDWVSNGAADDTALGDASKFQAIQDKIIQPKCTKCHTDEGSAEHIALDTVKDLTGGGEAFVLPKMADVSWLVEITQPGHAEMPPPTSGVAPITQEEWNVIKDWINSGANQ